MEIRTPKGKYYGDLDVSTYTLTTKDGRNIRRTPIPKGGCILQYIAGESTVEKIAIPPQQQLLKKAM